MNELLSHLNSVHPLSPALRQFLSEKFRTKNIARKEFLHKAGHINRHIYFIKQGLLRSYYSDQGHEICTHFIKEKDIIVSASSFFLQKESIESIQAIEDSTIWYFCFDELQYIYKHFPEFNIIARILVTKSYLLSEQRIRIIKTKQATHRYTTMLKHFPELILRVPAKYIASYLGMNEETLSRIRSNRNLLTIINLLLSAPLYFSQAG